MAGYMGLVRSAVSPHLPFQKSLGLWGLAPFGSRAADAYGDLRISSSLRAVSLPSWVKALTEKRHKPLGKFFK